MPPHALTAFFVRGQTQSDPVHTALGTPAAFSERSNSLQLVRSEDEIMSKLEELQEQVARAERLARSILDGITIERLLAFAAERT